MSVKFLYNGLTIGRMHAKTEVPPHIIRYSTTFSTHIPQACGKRNYIKNDIYNILQIHSVVALELLNHTNRRPSTVLNCSGTG